jgi:hypothetical protein
MPLKNFIFFLFKNKLFSFKNILASLFLLTIFWYSSFLGFTYTKYQADPWHWGTIAGVAIDYINGFKLFKEIPIVYGPGQPIFFKFINFFYNINLYSIGIITCIIYLLNIFFTFLILLKFSNKLTATTIIALIIAMVPYPQVPWPDFYSGFCLTISILSLTYYHNNKKDFFVILSSVFLVIAIAFRNTYILNIFPSLLIFFLSYYYFKENYYESLHKKILFYFLIFLFLFFFILFLTNNLHDWFFQGTTITKSHLYKLTELSNLNVNKTIGYSFLRFLYHLFIPKTLANLYFVLIFFFNILILTLFFLKKIIFTKNLEKSCLFFFSILGLFGVIQSFSHFETWRNINSSITIFIIFAYFLNQLQKKKYFYLIHFFIILISTLLLEFKKESYAPNLYFPSLGTVKYINNDFIFVPFKKDNYTETNIKYFGRHHLNKEQIYYYLKIKSIICKYDKIVNFSFDKNLVYICDKKNNIVNTFSDVYPPKFYNSKLQKKFTQDTIDNDTIVIADDNYLNKNLKLLKVVKIPKYTRYTKSDFYRQEFGDKIYLYIK